MMSDKVILSPVLIEDNAIVIADKSKIDFRLAIRQVDSNGVKSSVQLKNGLSSDGKTFVALFDDNDIDFEVEVHNKSFTKNMGFDMTYGIKYKFVIPKGERHVLKTLVENGNHLRFLSPNLPMAQMVVNLVAAEAVDRKRAEIVCSRIRFDMTVGKSDPIGQLKGQVVEVMVNMYGSKVRHFDIGLDSTVLDLKVMIEEREGIPVPTQVLVVSSKPVDDKQTLYELGVRNASVLSLVRRLESHPIGSAANKIQALHCSSQSGKRFGRRGVVGFGHRTDEHFVSCAFDADKDYMIEPFFIEFRLEK